MRIKCVVVELSVVSSQHQLGSAGSRWGSSAEERRLPAVQDTHRLWHKPPHADYWHATTELAQRTLGPSPLHYAKEVILKFLLRLPGGIAICRVCVLCLFINMYWGQISRKRLETETWFQWSTYNKWHIGNRMVTWPMTSRDPERSRSWPRYIWSQICWKRLELCISVAVQFVHNLGLFVRIGFESF